MKTILKLSFTVLLITLFTSCNSDDDNDSKGSILSVEIVFTEGEASYMKIVPIDEEIFYDANDVKEYEDTSNVSFTLPEYTNHFSLEIQGSQKKLKGYVKINGIKSEFNALDWYYQGTYYLSDYSK